MRNWGKRNIWSILTMLTVVFIGGPSIANECADSMYGISSLTGDANSGQGFEQIEITPPDEFVYGIVDGAVSPHQFTHMKAGLRSMLTDVTVYEGTLTAVARYRIQENYLEDLSNGPPGTEMLNKPFTSSISEPISVTGLDSVAPTLFAFDFSTMPIPAGITDLYLLVAFQGKIGDEAGVSMIVGTKDLYEPQHITIWNNTDRFHLFDQLWTPPQIMADPTAVEYLDNNCVPWDMWIQPAYTDLTIGFSASSGAPFSSVADYIQLPPAMYGKLIVIQDSANFIMDVNSVEFSIPGLTNQQNGETFTATNPALFRNINSHFYGGYIRTCSESGMGSVDLPQHLEDDLPGIPSSTPPDAAGNVLFP